MTVENDIVLIYFDNKPLAYARIEAITPDHKKGWYLVKLLILGIPLQAVYWILKDAYIDGAEFTMNNKTMRLEKVVCPPDSTAGDMTEVDFPADHVPEKSDRTARVIPFPGLPQD